MVSAYREKTLDYVVRKVDKMEKGQIVIDKGITQRTIREVRAVSTNIEV